MITFSLFNEPSLKLALSHVAFVDGRQEVRRRVDRYQTASF
jgi:hypothetical protein